MKDIQVRDFDHVIIICQSKISLIKSMNQIQNKVILKQ
jgi:hypothetical protein